MLPVRKKASSSSSSAWGVAKAARRLCCRSVAKAKATQHQRDGVLLRLLLSNGTGAFTVTATHFSFIFLSLLSLLL
jgi:hypothetical protein